MSKTAVLISGQMRTFAQCVANLNWQVFRRLENPTFFISCADDAEASHAYLLEGYFKDIHIEHVVQPTLPEPPFAACRHAPYTPTPNNASVIQPILRQLWHYKRVWEFMREKCGSHQVEISIPQKPPSNPDVLGIATHQSVPDFDVFVRCRPDLFFHRFDMPEKERLLPQDFVGPWKATCGGVNDRFSIMGSEAARAYFTAFDALPELLKAGCPLHPESIQQAALERAGCAISNTLLAEFTCIRMPGKGENVPLVEYPGELARFIHQSHL